MYVCEKLFLLFHRFNFIIQVFQKQEENKTMENSKSSYVKIINEICAEEGIKLSSYSYDWAFCLRKDQKRAFILGYQFGLNRLCSRYAMIKILQVRY